MYKPKISVIIPVYNVEDYLEDCLNSVLNQTIIDDIEVIMIDDGSTDNSRYIVEKYALDYDNFHAYHKENEGQGIARNFGIEQAKSDYVQFIDSDDYLIPTDCERLYEAIFTNDNDVVTSNVSKFTQNVIWKDVIFRNSFKNITRDIASTTIDEVPELVWDTISANKIYRKDFLEKFDLKFIDRRIKFEDIIFTFEVYNYARSIGIIHEDIYYWRFRPDESSITQNLMNITTFENRFEILGQIQDFINNHDVSDEVLNELYLKWLNHDFMMFFKRISNFEDDYEFVLSLIKDLLKNIPQELLSRTNGYNQIIYGCVKNDDIDNLFKFSKLSNELVRHAENHDLYNEFKDEFDFDNGLLYEEILSNVLDVKIEEDSLIVYFEYSIPFVPYKPDKKLSVKLVSNEDEYDLEYSKLHDDYQLKVPLKLIKNDNVYKIKIIHSHDKEGYVKSKKRLAFVHDNQEFNLGITNNRDLAISSRIINDNEIRINNSDFDGVNLTLKGISDRKIDKFAIENLVTFERKIYEADYSDNNFTVIIPFEDLYNFALTKWELKPVDTYKSIKIDNFRFFIKNKEIKFHNQRNKVIINLKNYTIDEVIRGFSAKQNKLEQKIKSLKKDKNSLENNNNNLKNEINDLKVNQDYLNDENIKLKNKNKELNDMIDEFKSRKVVKFADKLHF